MVKFELSNGKQFDLCPQCSEKAEGVKEDASVTAFELCAECCEKLLALQETVQ